MSRRVPGRGQEGFALVAVLLVLAFVGVIGAEFAYSMRLEATAARIYKETLIAAHLAEAAVEQAKRELAAEFAHVGLGDENDPETDRDCPIVLYGRDRVALKRLPHKNVALGPGEFSYCLSDEEARLNLNTTTQPDRMHRLLEALGVEREDRDTIWASLLDWKDPNETHRLNGAESEDTYLKAPLPYRAKNTPFDSVAELIQVKGITPKLLAGAEGRPGLASLVTVRTQGQVNLNTASREVLRALNVTDAEFSFIEQSRRLGPFTSVPGQLGGRNLAVTTRTFRIEAEGIVDGQVRARVQAIVQKRRGTGAAVRAAPGVSGESVTVLEWTGIR